uniref:NADH dehydrogenase subunit 7 n=1 Tax=Timema poppense TaxID=170557 RepID=A0A7R9DHD9_TIMPO|nr:unnamed protein product [Timema poppensis]
MQPVEVDRSFPLLKRLRCVRWGHIFQNITRFILAKEYEHKHTSGGGATLTVDQIADEGAIKVRILVGSKRGAKRWFPDAEFLKQFEGPVMFPDEVSSKWTRPVWCNKIAPVEKKVRNLTLNFGPQHPAAHGVLRLVMELDGEEHIKSVTDNEVCSLLNLGTCGLHVVYSSLRTGVESVDWDISSLLRHMYYLFTDSPARRALFTQLAECASFPLKFYGVQWLENAKCFQRALRIWDHVKFLKEEKLPKTKSVETLKRAACDPFLKCKLAFCKTIADECQPFLQRFQTSKQMTPYLFEAVEKLLRYPMNRCVKPDLMKCTGPKLLSIDTKK